MYLRTHPDDNHYAHPIDFTPVADLNLKKVISCMLIHVYAQLSHLAGIVACMFNYRLLLLQQAGVSIASIFLSDRSKQHKLAKAYIDTMSQALLQLKLNLCLI